MERLAAEDVEVVLEVGPGSQLANMAPRCLSEEQRARLSFVPCVASPADGSLDRVLQLVGVSGRTAGQVLFKRLRVPYPGCGRVPCIHACP